MQESLINEKKKKKKMFKSVGKINTNLLITKTKTNLTQENIKYAVLDTEAMPYNLGGNLHHLGFIARTVNIGNGNTHTYIIGHYNTSVKFTC